MPEATELDNQALADSLAMLQCHAASLNAARDALSAVISGIGQRLRDIGLGIGGWVDIATTKEVVRQLGYSKHGGNWHLLLREAKLPDKLPDKQTTWTFCEGPVWMRIEAVGRIPELLDTLVQRAEEQERLLKLKTLQALGILEGMH